MKAKDSRSTEVITLHGVVRGYWIWEEHCQCHDDPQSYYVQAHYTLTNEERIRNVRVCAVSFLLPRSTAESVREAVRV
jgi:hypothetical protein